MKLQPNSTHFEFLHCVGQVAVKLEPVNSKHPQLLYESKIYRILDGGVGIPHVHWSAPPQGSCAIRKEYAIE